MGHIHSRRHWLMSLLGTWQLGLIMVCVMASKTAFDASAGDSKPPGTIAAGTCTADLDTAIFKVYNECPKPGPCYWSTENEFCVFAANAKDDMGRLKLVPMITTEGRAPKLMQILFDARYSKRERFSGPRYSVSPVPGKGLGTISTGELQRGALILSDLPMLIIDHCMMATVPQYYLASLMNEAANRLSPKQLDRLMSLDVFGDKAPDNHYLVGRTYATNAYMLDPEGMIFGGECGIGALFPEISRMNHDCRPNAAYHFNPDTAMMEVHAVRPIAAGEEITVSYISPFITQAHRQSLLHDRWGFKCTCAACSAPAADVDASDIRLKKISSLWPLLLDDIEDGVLGTDDTVTKHTSELADLLISLAESEGLDAVMLQPYRAAALEWNALGESDKAQHYARLAVEYGTNSFGSRDSMVRDMQDLIQDPELHWSWRLRSSK